MEEIGGGAQPFEFENSSGAQPTCAAVRSQKIQRVLM
jgi:hypothetical protein